MQAQHVTVVDKGNSCGRGCIAGIVIVGAAILAGLAGIALMALRSRHRSEAYGRCAQPALPACDKSSCRQGKCGKLDVLYSNLLAQAPV